MLGLSRQPQPQEFYAPLIWAIAIRNLSETNGSGLQISPSLNPQSVEGGINNVGWIDPEWNPASRIPSTQRRK